MNDIQTLTSERTQINSNSLPVLNNNLSPIKSNIGTPNQKSPTLEVNGDPTQEKLTQPSTLPEINTNGHLEPEKKERYQSKF